MVIIQTWRSFLTCQICFLQDLYWLLNNLCANFFMCSLNDTWFKYKFILGRVVWKRENAKTTRKDYKKSVLPRNSVQTILFYSDHQILAGAHEDNLTQRPSGKKKQSLSHVSYEKSQKIVQLWLSKHYLHFPLTKVRS